MQYTEFLKTVQRFGDFATQDEALHGARAVLEVLIERLEGGEASNLLAQLPEELTQSLRPIDETDSSAGAQYSLAEFIHRVSRRAAVDEDTAQRQVRAVMATLQLAVSAGELGDLEAQLPEDFHSLFLPGGDPGIPQRGY